MVRTPRELPPGAGDQTKYCEYHRGVGHTTEECIKLKDEIERLIRRGALNQFVQRNGNLPGGQRREPPPDRRNAQGPRPVVGTIDTIAASFPDSVNSIAHSRAEAEVPAQDISFSKEDLEGLLVPHHDPLVITAELGDPGFRVKRILVDNGSSVNVLFTSTVSAMKIPSEKLQPAAGPIYGFDGAPVTAQGTIILPVTLGEFPKQSTRQVQFVIVDTESPYNAIFGRPLQAAFGAISSIPHLVMKFPTPAGVGVSKGNQEVARMCYLRQIGPSPGETGRVSQEGAGRLGRP